MDNSPLGKLPAELRNHIYELVLVQPGNIEVNIDSQTEELTAPSRNVQRALPLLETCHQIRQESLPIFCGANAFRLFHKSKRSHWYRQQDTKAWLDGIGSRAALIRNIVVHTNDWCLWEDSVRNIAEDLQAFRSMFTNPAQQIVVVFKIRFGVCWGTGSLQSADHGIGPFYLDLKKSTAVFLDQFRYEMDNKIKPLYQSTPAASGFIDDLEADTREFVSHLGSWQTN